MPIVDVYAPADVFPAELDEGLTRWLGYASLAAEGIEHPTSFHFESTGVFLHRMPIETVGTAHTSSARAVRIHILIPPGAFSPEATHWVAEEMAAIARQISGDPGLRTWVAVSEACEGGWGIGGYAFDSDDLKALTLEPGAVAA